ncbi:MULTISPECIES: L,D-transpeptidase [unclassified Anabaena]|uniref:L,D-transpeptidase n=1 Tax=unclassified Anabaena TaxID=2619674 RepID=UPI0016893442|nr:L,D-transpeptidase [Anabaena sp. UHCC 0399]MBD2362867.1 L,D-transpeptidase [Anabaena minutissima FACHB-250]MEA5564449.1 L,D-transpeptidase [Anabaena sp. UHCC 0399]
MQNWIRSTGRHCLGKFSPGAVIIMAALLSWLPPTAADTNPPKTVAASVNDSSISTSDIQQISQSRRIVIDLSAQRLFAWEGNKLVYSFRVSTGKRSTPTPTGKFTINSKYRINRMRGRGYDIPDVPYAMYFHKGYAIHGAYWHNRFGTPVSRGCVNLPVKQARKLYDWAANGTVVVVRK